jgi:hypothetical protein
MFSNRLTLCLAAAMLLTAGCVSPWSTRLPTLQTGSPAEEKRGYERHDPFPDVESGPETMTRPRGFDRPRNEGRQATEGYQNTRGLQPGAPGGPLISPPSTTYPNAVPQ